MTMRRRRINEGAYYPPGLPYDPGYRHPVRISPLEAHFRLAIALWAKRIRRQQQRPDDERRRLRAHVADSIERDGWQYADYIGDQNEATDADNYGGESGW
jgi:hypothetical protein